MYIKEQKGRNTKIQIYKKYFIQSQYLAWILRIFSKENHTQKRYSDI